MRIGLVGLGRMGLNMGRRWLEGGHAVVGFNRSPEAGRELVKAGGSAVASVKDLVAALEAPRIVWLMVPAGEPVERLVEELAGLLSKGDVVVDGGNSFYKDDIRRAEALASKGIGYLDVGVSGGLWGLSLGYCVMAGGEKSAYDRVEPLLKTLTTENGYLHCGKTGSGHFVKMVHNGIEYGMMQAYAEGFEILKASGFQLDLHRISHLWNHGSVVRSWLLELAENALKEDPGLDKVSGYVEDSGEGRWTVQQAVEVGVAAPVIALSLFERFTSRQKDPFAFRFLAALRNAFGGHAVVPAGSDARKSAAGAGAVQAAKGAKAL